MVLCLGESTPAKEYIGRRKTSSIARNIANERAVFFRAFLKNTNTTANNGKVSNTALCLTEVAKKQKKANKKSERYNKIALSACDGGLEGYALGTVGGGIGCVFYITACENTAVGAEQCRPHAEA